MRVLIAGGGTGGHVYPGLTIAATLRQRHPDVAILFVGSDRGLEADVIPREGYPLRTLRVRYLGRKLSLALVATVLRAGQALWQSIRIIREFRPDVVVGTGGYVAGPVVLAARALRVPVLIQEQNALPGLTNRLLARFARCVALGYAEAARWLPRGAAVVVTGNPIRTEILTQDRQAGAARLGLDPRRATAIVFAGSQGGRRINAVMAGALPTFLARPEVQVVHVTGQAGFAEVAAELARQGIRPHRQGHIIRGNVRILPYIYDMQDAYAAADLVVGRAGAISIAEITARGLPAILIPYPYAAERHQDYNARVLGEAGAAVILRDAELSAERLAGLILSLLSDRRRLAEMGAASRRLGRPEAARRVAELVEELAAVRR